MKVPVHLLILLVFDAFALLLNVSSCRMVLLFVRSLETS
jgi:hypothetical protein